MPGVVVSSVVGLVLLALALPVGLFALEVISASVFGIRQRRAGPIGQVEPSVAVLVPAHDEAGGIAATVESLRPQLKPGDRLVVVADNCSDDTAAVARRAGAEVVERRDLQRRGKGYALDFGLRALSASPPDVLVVVDADCHVAPGSLAALAQRVQASGRPAQALDLMRAPPGAGLRQRVAAFAWIVKNMVRPAGAAHLGMPCQLMGTGMAFPWRVLEGVSLATGHIVEDMKLGVELALAGTPPVFEPAALVTSEFPLSTDATRSQRTRWEHGHLEVLTRLGPRLLLRGLGRGDLAAIALAADLMVPPLSLLFMAVLGVTVPVLVAASFAGFGPLSALAAAVLCVFVFSVLLAWVRFGRTALSLADLLRAPLYALAKVPMYVRFLAGRQADWVRTRRRDEG